MSTPRARHYRHDALTWRPDVDGARYWAVALEHTLLTGFEVEAHCRFPEHRHHAEQITHVLEGELFFVVEGVEYRVGAGDVIAIPSLIPHAVFTREHRARAVDAWSPVPPAYARDATAPETHTDTGVDHES
jgi:quercetin dioxygenase-like cupin family protein